MAALTGDQVLERAYWLVRSQRPRTQMQEELQRVFQLDWNDDALVNKPDWVKEVKDPQPFNSMQWLVDVLAAEEPTVTIKIPQDAMPQPLQMQDPEGIASIGAPPPPMGMQGMMPQGMPPMPMQGSGAKQTNLSDAVEMADLLENMVREVFKQNEDRNPTSLQRDELYAGFVNGMVCNKIADLRLGKRWAAYAAWEKGASPFFIKSQNPAHIYFEYDEFGLGEVLHRYLRSIKDVKRMYPAKAAELFGMDDKVSAGFVVFNEYWTPEIQAKWIATTIIETDYSNNETISADVMGAQWIEEPKVNTLGFIPYALKVARGTSVFNDTTQVYPQLYAGHKSKLFLRNNLFLTVASTLAFMLVNPQMIHESASGETQIELDFSRPNVWAVKTGDRITQVNVNLSRDFYEVMGVLKEKVELSTVSPTIAGQGPGGVTAASGINLLIQGGKLTLTPVQSGVQENRAQTIKKIFDYIKAYPRFANDPSIGMYVGDAYHNVDPASLPDRMDISVKYTASLPQDKALAMQTYLTAYLKHAISQDYFFDAIEVQDKSKIKREIDEDKADEQMEMQAQMQAQKQAQASQQPPQGQPPTGQEGQPPPQGDQMLEPVTPNPLPDEQNPADALNEMFNAVQNPAGGQ